MKYPNITVKLTGGDGNAFFILGKVQRELQYAGVPKEEIDIFLEEAMSGDYGHLLRTCGEWVNVK